MKKELLTILIILLGLFVFAPFVYASPTIGNVIGYAFGDYLGWVNFGCTNCNVHVTDAGITGYAWSQNFGWINLNPLKNNAAGTLSGEAWGEKTGWINFTHVTINSAGHFLGLAPVDIGGNLNFSCDRCNVLTDWEYASLRPSSNNASASGVGVSSAGNPLSISITSVNSVAPAVPVASTTTTTTIIHATISTTSTNLGVVVTGTTTPNTQVIVAYDKQYGLATSDSNGNWSLNLGMLQAGLYPIIAEALDGKGNVKSIRATISVKSFAPVQNPIARQLTNIANQPVVKNVLKGLQFAFNFLAPIPRFTLQIPKLPKLSQFPRFSLPIPKFLKLNQSSWWSELWNLLPVKSQSWNLLPVKKK